MTQPFWPGLASPTHHQQTNSVEVLFFPLAGRLLFEVGFRPPSSVFAEGLIDLFFFNYSLD